MKYYVYILVSKDNSVMYVGVTNNLARRLEEHQSDQVEGFTKKYHVHKLVYFEKYSEINDAIAREKQIKGWKREKKNELVKAVNPDFEVWDNEVV